MFLLLFFIQAPEFPEFTAKVQEAISSLGGSVFPKLNWSAPRVRMLTLKTCNRCCRTEYFVFIFSQCFGKKKSGSDEGRSDTQDISEMVDFLI